MPPPRPAPPGGVKSVQLSFKMRLREAARGSCPSPGPRPSPRLARPPPARGQKCATVVQNAPPGDCARLLPELRPKAIPTPGPAAPRRCTPGRCAPGGTQRGLCPSSGPRPYPRLPGAPPGGIQRGSARARARGHTDARPVAPRGYTARLCPSTGPWPHTPPGASQRPGQDNTRDQTPPGARHRPGQAVRLQYTAPLIGGWG